LCVINNFSRNWSIKLGAGIGGQKIAKELFNKWENILEQGGKLQNSCSTKEKILFNKS
jgi:hypothetical protein